MLELAVVALTTFIVTIGPVDVAVMFAMLTAHSGTEQRRVMAWRGTLLATIILLLFALLGDAMLTWLGISLPALRTAGGILLFLIGVDMVFARTSGGVSTTEDETQEARTRQDLSVFPLATPLIAGPGAMGAVILLMGGAREDYLAQAVILLCLLVVLALTLACLLAAVHIHRYLGVTGAHVLTRVFGVLLCALAVQFVFDGIAGSGIMG